MPWGLTSTSSLFVATNGAPSSASLPYHNPEGGLSPDSRRHLSSNALTTSGTPHTRILDDAPGERIVFRLEQAFKIPFHPLTNSALRKSSQMRQSYEATGDLRHLDSAINSLQKAVGSTWNPWRSIDLWKTLGSCLYQRYGLSGRLDDLDAAIAAQRRAVDIMTKCHSNKPELLHHLGRSLRRRFRRLELLEDLNGAIKVLRRAIAIERRPQFSAELGLCLRYRFETLGKVHDLGAAITSVKRAIALTPIKHHSKPHYLEELSLCLRCSFENLGKLEDLDNAIIVIQSAIELVLNGHQAKIGFLANLCSLFYLRFERLDKLEDINCAIETCQQEVVLIKDSQTSKHTRLTQLSHYLRRRFERFGKLEDLERAITESRHAVQLEHNTHTGGLKSMVTLRGLFDLRFERLHALADNDLDGAIARCRRNVEDDRCCDLNRAEQYSNLGLYLHHRFERLGNLSDLEESISSTQKAIAFKPDDHSGNSEQLMTLGRSLLRRYQRFNDLIDLESTILCTQLALEAIDDGHHAQRIGYVTLGFGLQYRFDHYKGIEDIDKAILARYRAVELTPDTHPDTHRVLDELFLSLHSRLLHYRTSPNYEETRTCLTTAFSKCLGESSTRLRAATRYAQLLSDFPEFSSPESLLQAHAQIIDTLPEIAWLGHSIQRRFAETARLGELVNTAVGAAIGAGALRQAVEWLEAGRTLIWAQILSLRTPLDDISDHHPDLALSLFDIHLELQGSGFASADRHRVIVAKYENLMSKIRHCVGCKNFLRPRRLAGLISSPAFGLFSGTLVLINVAQSSCDALLLSSTGNIRSVQLPNLTLSRAQKMHDLWTRQVELCGLRRRGVVQHGSNVRGSSAIFARVLEHLWVWVVYPILKDLGFSRCPASGQLPHVVWCPTGPLTQLPLHAAGAYDGVQSGPRVFEFVVSSYIPSLSALLRCCDGVVKEYPTPNVLVVTQPDTPGRSPLPGTQSESALLRAILPGNKQTLLEHKQATVDYTLAVIGRHPWIHFACHGSQNLEDPTQSAFALYDGLLTLSTLMSTVADNAELAFLSACQTAAGDEKIPEESAHLAAGMLAVGFKGVVATMWSIRDEDAPVVVEEYYKKLLEFRNTGSVQRGQTGAGYALHEATKRLREQIGERSFERWVPFVHYGV